MAREIPGPIAIQKFQGAVVGEAALAGLFKLASIAIDHSSLNTSPAPLLPTTGEILDFSSKAILTGAGITELVLIGGTIMLGISELSVLRAKRRAETSRRQRPQL